MLPSGGRGTAPFVCCADVKIERGPWTISFTDINVCLYDLQVKGAKPGT